jgi:hypothetical protein
MPALPLSRAKRPWSLDCGAPVVRPCVINCTGLSIFREVHFIRIYDYNDGRVHKEGKESRSKSPDNLDCDRASGEDLEDLCFGLGTL